MKVKKLELGKNANIFEKLESELNIFLSLHGRSLPTKESFLKYPIRFYPILFLIGTIIGPNKENLSQLMISALKCHSQINLLCPREPVIMALISAIILCEMLGEGSTH